MASRLAARIRRRGQESSSLFTSRGGGLQEVLAVVHQKEQLSVPQDLGQRVVVERLRGAVGYLEGLGHLLGHERPLGERGELHQPHPVWVGRSECPADLQGEPRFGRAARAGEGEEPRRL